MSQDQRKFRSLLEPHQVAEMLGTTVGTLAVWRCTKRYPLSYVKMGFNVKYKAEDVEEFIKARRVDVKDVD